jgi:hypothetical protein
MYGQEDNKQLTFGGWPVEFRVVGDEVLVNCKNVTGTYSQAKAFVKNQYPTNTYPWGIKTTKPAFLENIPGGNVNIACLEDTKAKFMELYYECERLLGI